MISLKKKQTKKKQFTVKVKLWNKECHSQRGTDVPQSHGTTTDTSVSFATPQQGEQTIAGVGVVISYPSGSAQAPHKNTNALQLCTNNIRGQIYLPPAEPCTY